jgi:hypothetical protein
VKKHFTDVGVSGYADVTGSVNDDTMSLSWITEGGAEGSSVLPRSTADKPSTLTVLGAVRDWATYKAHVGSLEHRRFIFRGQNEPWRLRTSYHRTGRADLRRFLAQDVQVLHRHLSARTRHVFNLSVPDENGAFFNLVQHHGYPTPLLDWTYSPYVAAFFAFRDITNKQAAKAGPTEKVRIHVLDQAMWKKDWAQLQDLLPAGLHLSVSEFVSIENERLIPQQAVSTLTNIDDIESYVKDREELSGKSYLVAIDLPVQERANVVRELSSMGITAGSLFPGLDGACEELTERNFNI